MRVSIKSYNFLLVFTDWQSYLRYSYVLQVTITAISESKHSGGEKCIDKVVSEMFFENFSPFDFAIQ